MQAFLVAIAIVQAAALVVLARHMRKELKKDGGAPQRELRLIELYGHVEELMDVFESYIDEVRQDIEKERASLTEMSRQAATLYMRALEPKAVPLAAAVPYLAQVPEQGPADMSHVPLTTTNAQLSALTSPLLGDVPLTAFPARPARSEPRIVRPAPPAKEPATNQPSTVNGHPSRLSERDREALGRFATKPQKVRFLMSRGQSLEEVARELGIGRGEVRLIAELEK